jgi:hypothetical protein
LGTEFTTIMNGFQRTLHAATALAALAGAWRAQAQAPVNWIGPVGVEAAWDQNANWDNVGFNLQPNWTFGEYGSVSNGGVAVIDHAIAQPTAGIRLGEAAATSGSLVIRNSGSIELKPSDTGFGGDGRLANGLNGAGTLTLRDNMGPVPVVSYTQNAASTLIAQLTAAGTFAGANRITASTQITIDGTLRLERPAGGSFVASAGNSWTLISGAPVGGAFDNVIVDTALRGNAGQAFIVNTASNAVTVNVEQRLVLQVDRFTGATKLVNPAGHAVNVPFISYTLSSPGNGVSSAPSRWTSFSDSGVSGWFEANPTATQLSELSPTGTLTMTSGQVRNLGTPINANVAAPLGTNRVNTGDVAFQYQSPTGQLISAVVEPVGRINDLVLVVNPANGSAIIQNQSSQALSFISYTISSASASLNAGYAGLSGIPLAAWFKANPSATNLSELSTTSVANMAVGSELALGTAWNALAGGRDLTFRYQLPDGLLRIGAVVFGDKAVFENADFDCDNDVDGNDFLRWQRGLGLTGQTNRSNGDANGDGSVTSADLAVWRNQFGTTPTTVVAAAVPEPGAVVLATGLVLALGARRKHGGLGAVR